MLNNISIKKRLFLLTGFMSLILLLNGFIALRSIQHTVQGIDSIYFEGADSIEDLNEMKQAVSRKIIETLEKLREDSLSWNQAELTVGQAQPIFGQYMNLYLEHISEDHRKRSADLQEFIRRSKEELVKIIEIIQKQNKEVLISYISNEMYPFFNPVQDKIQEYIKFHIEDTRQEYMEATATAERAIHWMFIYILGSILLAIVFAGLIIESISNPLNEAVTAVEQLTTGDTRMQVEINGHDETTLLMTAVQKMINSTKKMSSVLATVADGNLIVEIPIRSEHDSFGKALNLMVDGLKQIISEIQSEVNVLTNSTQNIVTSVNQVSTGTSETAAAVTETTTTVEELKQTAYVSAEKAKDVLINAEDTMKIVKNSETTLHLTVDEMNQIQEKMRIISQSIVKLSEHSSAIGEIINSVNNLAEQSNLLAVNAAIEAAKAGDQGKSFGVVAQEIRTLAEQSKEATVQVRAILNDIQNATSAAILATEQGSKAVTKGVAQSSQLSEAVYNLSASISKVTIAANQIAISSQQQLIGIDQVTVAMTNINEASNQHVEHMRQIENAVGLVNKVAGSLKEMVNQYRIAPPDKIGQKLGITHPNS